MPKVIPLSLIDTAPDETAKLSELNDAIPLIDTVASLIDTAPDDTAKLSESKDAIPLVDIVASSTDIVNVLPDRFV